MSKQKKLKYGFCEFAIFIILRYTVKLPFNEIFFPTMLYGRFTVFSLNNWV